MGLELIRGRTNVEDVPSNGRSKNATTPEIIEKVHDIIGGDLCLIEQEIP